jgi:predicted O-methyltransferase YrrM
MKGGRRMGMLKKMARNVCQNILDNYGEKDAKRLPTYFDVFSDYYGFIASDLPDLKPAYQKYVNQISTFDMAISFETSQLLYTLAKIKKAKRILDLGSGFSSYVMRLYAKNSGNDIVVYSVDDDKNWLEKTRDFLVAMQVSAEHVLEWNDFKEKAPTGFDLISHDLGGLEIRAESLPFVLNLLDKSGIIVLDDMHKARGGLIGGYRAIAIKEVKKTGMMRLSARKYTLDTISRFSEIAFYPPAS